MLLGWALVVAAAAAVFFLVVRATAAVLRGMKSGRPGQAAAPKFVDLGVHGGHRRLSSALCAAGDGWQRRQQDEQDQQAWSRRELMGRAGTVSAAAAVSLLGGRPVASQAEEEPVPIDAPREVMLRLQTVTLGTPPLAPYKDVYKGWRLLRPNNWTEFTGNDQGYLAKWQDTVGVDQVEVSAADTDLKTVFELGDPTKVGLKLASKRSNTTLVSASASSRTNANVYDQRSQYLEKPIPMYTFELQSDQSHELLLLAIDRGQLWRVSAVASAKTWKKKEKLYRDLLSSFFPRLS